MKLRQPSWILAALLLGGCSGSHAAQHTIRPGWIPSPNRSHPDFLFVTGTCRDQPDHTSARRCAIADAARQIARQIRSNRRVEVRGSYIKDEHFERRDSTSGAVTDAWVLVACPRDELKKAEDQVADRTLLGLRCRADTAAACDPALTAQLEAGATRVGLRPTPKPLPPEIVGDPERARDRAARGHAAKLLLVSLDGRYAGSDGGEHYARARCQLRLLDVASGKLLASAGPPRPIKGGHIARTPAVRKALHDCLDWLLSKLDRATPSSGAP